LLLKNELLLCEYGNIIKECKIENNTKEFLNELYLFILSVPEKLISFNEKNKFLHQTINYMEERLYYLSSLVSQFFDNLVGSSIPILEKKELSVINTNFYLISLRTMSFIDQIFIKYGNMFYENNEVYKKAINKYIFLGYTIISIIKST